MPKTTLEKLCAMLDGPITAYDGKWTIWYKVNHPNMMLGSVDLRDIKIKGVTVRDLIDALPNFDKPRRGKVAVNDSEE